MATFKLPVRMLRFWDAYVGVRTPATSPLALFSRLSFVVYLGRGRVNTRNARGHITEQCSSNKNRPQHMLRDIQHGHVAGTKSRVVHMLQRLVSPCMVILFEANTTRSLSPRHVAWNYTSCNFCDIPTGPDKISAKFVLHELKKYHHTRKRESLKRVLGRCPRCYIFCCVRVHL